MRARLLLAPMLLLLWSAAATGAEPQTFASDEALRAAAEQGVAEAQYQLADLLAFGGDSPAGPPAAIAWYRKAAEQGHVEAQYWLGLVHYIGHGVETNDAEAYKWWRRAAEQGHPKAQNSLAGGYQIGSGGLPVDVAEAARWYRKAADQDNSDAQESLARLYLAGEGVPQSDTEAVAWLRRAVRQPGASADAQLSLAELYATGRGTAKDEQLAADWYRSAADAGSTVAMAAIGDAFAAGRGVPKDPVWAYYWHSLAVKRGIEASEWRRAELGPSLRAADLAEVQRLIAATTIAKDGVVSRPQGPGELISISVRDAELADILALFRELTGMPVVGLEGETRKVTLKVEDVSWQDALTRALESLGYRWVRDGDVLRAVPVKPRSDS